jgi:hypothetical protein
MVLIQCNIISLEAILEVIINFFRPGKGTTRYFEGLVDEDHVRIKTLTQLTPEISQRWCEEHLWQNGYVSRGTLVGAVVKFLYFREWYSVMQLLGTDSTHLGYYIDINTPLRRFGNEIYLTDLFLDLWITPEGAFIELDREEFEQAFRSSLITLTQYKKASQAQKMITNQSIGRDFFRNIY